MDSILHFTKNFYFILLCFLVIINTSKQNINPLVVKVELDNSELKPLYIEDNTKNICTKWLPSLLSPILLYFGEEFKETKESIFDIEEFWEPAISSVKGYPISIYNFDLLNQYDCYLGVDRFHQLNEPCYLGLSSRKGFNDLDEKYIMLNILKQNKTISKKVFSFDAWNLNYTNLIQTFLYFGEEHEHFKLKDKEGIVGKCKVNKEYDYWGCSFTEMFFNNKTLDLRNSTGDLYKIYFSSENYNIIFPLSFADKFNESVKNKCYYPSDHLENKIYLECKDLFEKDDVVNLKLISDDINITIEIDNMKRFDKRNDDINKNKTRIKFEDSDYFLLPLITLKKFHVQFDAENDLIYFYTTDKTLLEVKPKKESENRSSNGLKAFLIILIIILVLALGYGVFLFIKRRRGAVQKDINKYNKFDEDENFQNMNEKRVF